ncbi:MAG: S1 RNA-binding domain-containing protein [Caldimicrobium sp.]
MSLIGKNKGKVYQMGQKVRVKIKDVDLRRFQINFLLVN